MNRLLYLIRHGLIQSNIEHVYAGRNEEDLTEAGREQAEAAGREMRGWRVSAVYTSPLKRAVRTAEIIGRHIGAKVLIDPNLIEMDLGPWTGLSRNEVATIYTAEYETWCRTPAEFRLDGMETIEEIQSRVIRAINRFRYGSPDRVAAMVTHAAPIKCAYLYVNRLPLNLYHKTHVPNLSIFRISFSGDRRSIVRVK